jgi:hypothetical protein
MRFFYLELVPTRRNGARRGKGLAGQCGRTVRARTVRPGGGGRGRRGSTVGWRGHRSSGEQRGGSGVVDSEQGREESLGERELVEGERSSG